MARSTYDNIIEEGKKLGFAEGKEQGIEQGIASNKRQVSLELIRNTDFSDEKIALIVGASTDFVAKLRAEA